MSIKLDHTVIYAKSHDKAAHEFAEVMGLPHGTIAGAGYEFTAVRVNEDLSIYFMERDAIHLEQHMAFQVDGQSFDHIQQQLKKNKITFGNSPFERDNYCTNHDFAPRGLFWTNVDGCLFEIMTYDF